MNKETVKMKILNVDGVEIIKDVPAELYSNYVAIGWEKVEDKKDKTSFVKSIKSNKEVE